MYIGNGVHEITTSSGSVIRFDENELSEIMFGMFNEIKDNSSVYLDDIDFYTLLESSKNFQKVNTMIETSEIKNFENIVEKILDITFESVQEYYQSKYFFQKKYK